MPIFTCSIFILMIKIQLAVTITCYNCASINGSNPLCEDFFEGDSTETQSLLQTPCLTYLRGRKGLFPATHCIKLLAYSMGSRMNQYVYRTCGRDEGDAKSITRTSHCGFVKLDWIDKNRIFRGCLHICDTDACNQSSSLRSFSFWRALLTFIALIYFQRTIK